MILNIIVALLIAGLVMILAMLVYAGIENSIVIKIGCVLAVITWIVLTLFLNQLDNVRYEKYIASYEAQKQTYEYSFNDEQLSGFERAEIVKVAIENNAELAEKKIEVKKWYSFYIRKDIRNKIEKLRFTGVID